MFSVEVIGPSIKLQIWSLCLQGHQFPRSTQSLSPSPPSPPTWSPEIYLLSPSNKSREHVAACIPHCPALLSDWFRLWETPTRTGPMHSYGDWGLYIGGLEPGETRFSLQRPLQHRDPHMAPTITSAITSSEELLTLTHKVNSRLNLTKHFESNHSMYWRWHEVCISVFNISLSFSRSENHWWRSYAESESTAALSSSSLCWVQSSSNKSLTPRWRKQTSWRWRLTLWDNSSSIAMETPLHQQQTRVTPGVSRKWSASCLEMRWRHSPAEECCTTSRTFSHFLIQDWLRLVHFSWALHSSPAPPKRRVQITAPPGGPGRNVQTGEQGWPCWSQVFVNVQYQPNIVIGWMFARSHYSSKRRKPQHHFLILIVSYRINCLLLQTPIGAFADLKIWSSNSMEFFFWRYWTLLLPCKDSVHLMYLFPF